MAVYEIPDFRTGKQVTRGVPTPTEPFAVTVVTRDAADEFFRTHGEKERAKHLRALRDLGLLVHNHGRLTQTVRCEAGSRIRAYVMRGTIVDVPRRKRREGGGVVEWD